MLTTLYPIEIKVLHNAKTIPEGLKQTCDYMQKCGANEGWLVVFNRDKNTPWDEKIFLKEEIYNGKRITVVGI